MRLAAVRCGIDLLVHGGHGLLLFAATLNHNVFIDASLARFVLRFSPALFTNILRTNSARVVSKYISNINSISGSSD